MWGDSCKPVQVVFSGPVINTRLHDTANKVPSWVVVSLSLTHVTAARTLNQNYYNVTAFKLYAVLSIAHLKD